MKERLDTLLVGRKLAESREKAKVIIKSGNVLVGGKKADKPGDTYPEDAVIEIKENPLLYVSRGGYKLAKAINRFSICLQGKICMDIGASTGGFTDCMLQNGALKVYSIDVGTDQLAQKLKQDERVISLEKTNIRYLTPDQIKADISFASVDVSFISLTKVLLPVRELLTMDGEIVSLIKPQFEAGREKVGKNGVVRDPKLHSEIITLVSGYANSIGFDCIGLDFSPIKGPEGNIEYLLYLRKKIYRQSDGQLITGGVLSPQIILKTVEEAHKELT